MPFPIPKNFRLIVVPFVVPLAIAAFWSKMYLNEVAPQAGWDDDHNHIDCHSRSGCRAIVTSIAGIGSRFSDAVQRTDTSPRGTAYDSVQRAKSFVLYLENLESAKNIWRN